VSAAAGLAAIASVAALLAAREWCRGFAVLGPGGRRVPGVRTVRLLLSPGSDFREKMAVAGEPAGLGPRDWLSVKCATAVTVGVASLVFGSAVPGRLPLLLAVTAPIAGFFAPDQWLAWRTRRRLEAAVTELPDMLDLFGVTVAAGMPAAHALGVVASEFDGPLAREWATAAGQMELGISQDDALEALARRLPADEIKSFVEALSRSRRRGVPIGRATAAQATVARHHRRRRVRERAARAGPKIQLVVALLLVPSVLLLVAAGLVVELQGSPIQGFPG
jgi:tight adherence protein C